jgi:hypothetical protein
MAITKNNPQDYEKDLDSFLQADYNEGEADENAEATYEYVSGSSIELGEPKEEDFYEADGDDDSYIYDIDFSEFKGKDFKSPELFNSISLAQGRKLST